MKKIIFAVCLFCGFLLFSSQNSYACQCSDHFTPLIVHYTRAESVFVGKVITVKKSGNESEREAWYPKYRTVEFQIQKIYKGIKSSTKRITLNTNFNPATCGNDEDEAAKKKQQWIVFVYRDEKDNSLSYGGMCDPSSQLKKASDLSEYEDKFFFDKNKQAIIGTIVDDMKIEGIKDIEVILEGEGQNLTTRTDEKGLYYFPITSKGNYKIIINIPFPAFISGGSFIIKENPTKENANEDAKILKNILNYEIQLKDGEFNYNEIDLFVLQPKRSN